MGMPSSFSPSTRLNSVMITIFMLGCTNSECPSYHSSGLLQWCNFHFLTLHINLSFCILTLHNNLSFHFLMFYIPHALEVYMFILTEPLVFYGRLGNVLKLEFQLFCLYCSSHR
jgi:hypothetical protein